MTLNESAYRCENCMRNFMTYITSCPYCGSSNIWHDGHPVEDERGAYDEYIDDMIDEMRDNGDV